MNWIIALMLCFFCWSTYVIPGNFAEKVHGVSVNMLFETLAFAGVTIFLSGKIIEAIPKITMTSAIQGSLMGIGSAVGFYFFITAISLAQGTKDIVFIFLIVGITFPVQGVLFSFFGESLDTHQWWAIAGMMACIVIYNWKF